MFCLCVAHFNRDRQLFGLPARRQLSGRLLARRPGGLPRLPQHRGQQLILLLQLVIWRIAGVAAPAGRPGPPAPSPGGPWPGGGWSRWPAARPPAAAQAVHRVGVAAQPVGRGLLRKHHSHLLALLLHARPPLALLVLLLPLLLPPLSLQPAASPRLAALSRPIPPGLTICKHVK